jgi:hypothetical protein
VKYQWSRRLEVFIVFLWICVDACLAICFRDLPLGRVDDFVYKFHDQGTEVNNAQEILLEITSSRTMNVLV